MVVFSWRAQTATRSLWLSPSPTGVWFCVDYWTQDERKELLHSLWPPGKNIHTREDMCFSHQTNLMNNQMEPEEGSGRQFSGAGRVPFLSSRIMCIPKKPGSARSFSFTVLFCGRNKTIKEAVNIWACFAKGARLGKVQNRKQLNCANHWLCELVLVNHSFRSLEIDLRKQ